MRNRVLPTVDDQIRKYRDEHQGNTPLYVILSGDEADHLIEEIRASKGYDEKVIVTEHNGLKIVKHPAVKPGEIRLTNELPETGA